MNHYSRVIQHCWNNLVGELPPNGSYFFSKEDLEKAATELGFQIKNIADIRYTFDSRESLPFSSDYGILQTGKGKYAFVPSEDNLVDMPIIQQAYVMADKTPAFAKKYLSADEQAAITKLSSSGCFDLIPGLSNVQRLQDHWRTTCSFGQIEIDGLASAKLNDGRDSLVLISAKQYPGKVSKTYLYNVGRLAKEKFPEEHCTIANVYCADNCFIVWTCKTGTTPDDLQIDSCTAFYLF
jgi:hypothetical protein